MIRFYSTLFFIFIFCTGLFIPASAQNPVQLSVQFKKNKYVLTDEAKAVLSKVKDTIGDYVLDKIVVKGYTDSDADSAYNAKLSANRCSAVKDFLVQDGIDASKISTAAYGEYFPLVENSNENNKSRNRRVDLIITMHFPQIVKITPIKKDTCLGDTLVDAGYGVLMLVNKCSYHTNSNCMQIAIQRREEYDLKFSHFRQKLGMKNCLKKKNESVIYYASVQCKDTTCGDDGRKLYIPAFETSEKKVTVSKYDSAQGKYVKQKEPKVKAIKKKSYAVMPLNCHTGKPDHYLFLCGSYIDYGPCGCNPLKLVFKDRIKILEALAYDSAETGISADSTKLDFFPGNGLEKLVLLNGSDTVTLENVQVNALNHGFRRIKNCDAEKWFLFIKFHPKCEAYRKYKFKRKDIDIQKNKPWEGN